MRPIISGVCTLILGLYAGGCGTDGGSGSGDPDGGNNPGADASPDGWQPLIAGDWELQPGTETYKCVRTTVPEDLYINQFRALTPLGTHHTVLAIDEAGGPDGVFDCQASTQGNAAIFGSGVDTNPIVFPEGVAVKIEAGQQLLINLHLFNLSDEVLTGTSGTEIKTIPQSEMQYEAEMILMGKIAGLSVPTGESTQVGRCVMNGDVTLFAVNPHMHQLGTHMKMIAKSSVVGETVIHDAPFDFEDQRIYSLDPLIEMKQGDEVEIHCSYNNTTGSTVTFGDSSTEEMCFGTTYRYPARGGQFGSIFCDSGGF